MSNHIISDSDKVDIRKKLGPNQVDMCFKLENIAQIQDCTIKINLKNLLSVYNELLCAHISKNLNIETNDYLDYFELENECKTVVIPHENKALILNTYKNIVHDEIQRDVKAFYKTIVFQEQKKYVSKMIDKYVEKHSEYPQLFLWVKNTVFCLLKENFGVVEHLLKKEHFNVEFLIFVAVEFHRASNSALNFRFNKFASLLLESNKKIIKKIAVYLSVKIDDELNCLFGTKWYSLGIKTQVFKDLKDELLELRAKTNNLIFYKTFMEILNRILLWYVRKAAGGNSLILSDIEEKLKDDIEKYYEIFAIMVGALEKKLSVLYHIPKIIKTKFANQFLQSAAQVLRYVPGVEKQDIANLIEKKANNNYVLREIMTRELNLLYEDFLSKKLYKYEINQPEFLDDSI